MTAPLPYSDERHVRAHQFLVEEAHLLDSQQFEAWLGLLAEDIRYVMPVRVTAAKGADEASLATVDHFDEDLYSLRKRVERLATEHAWTEDPPSRVRHHVGNVRTFAIGGADGTEGTEELRVESALLLFRSRGDDRAPAIVSAGRVDTLRPSPGGLRLARRHIQIDEAVVRMQNLAVFL